MIRRCLLPRSVLYVQGPDSAKFLQGLITNQIGLLEKSDAIFAAFLNAQGRVLYDAMIYSHSKGDGLSSYFIDVDTAAAEPLIEHFKRFVLRSKVLFGNVSASHRVVQAWGPGSNMLLGQKSVSDGAVCVDPRNRRLGVRLVVGDHDGSSGVPEGVTVSEESPTAYAIRRILLAVPEGVEDFFVGTSLPLESNLDVLNGVDFRKGCYLGQELTTRTYHTGVTRKRIVPVQLYPLGTEPPSEIKVDVNFKHALPASASEIVISSPSASAGSRKREAGWFCSGVHNIGLALVRLEHIGQPMITANGLGVKPFLPTWSLND